MPVGLKIAAKLYNKMEAVMKEFIEQEKLLEDEEDPPTWWGRVKKFIQGPVSSTGWAVYTIFVLGIAAFVMYVLIEVF